MKLSWAPVTQSLNSFGAKDHQETTRHEGKIYNPWSVSRQLLASAVKSIDAGVETGDPW